MKIGLDCGPIGGLLKMEDDPLGLLDLAIEYGFEGVLLSSRPLREDETLRRQVIGKARADDLYISVSTPPMPSSCATRSWRGVRHEPLRRCQTFARVGRGHGHLFLPLG
jgi:hypothetical protein